MLKLLLIFLIALYWVVYIFAYFDTTSNTKRAIWGIAGSLATAGAILTLLATTGGN